MLCQELIASIYAQSAEIPTSWLLLCWYSSVARKAFRRNVGWLETECRSALSMSYPIPFNCREHTIKVISLLDLRFMNSKSV